MYKRQVYLREILESEAFKKHKSKLAFAVGKDIGGQVVVADIAKTVSYTHLADPRWENQF